MVTVSWKGTGFSGSTRLALPVLDHTRSILHFGNNILRLLGQFITSCRDGGRFTFYIFVFNYTVDLLRIGVLRVKCEFIIDIQTYQQKTNQAEGQARYIKSRVKFVSPKISPSGFKITS